MLQAYVSNNFLRVLRAAHTVQRAIRFFQCALSWLMLQLLPTRLHRALFSTNIQQHASRHSSSMVATRRQRCSQESFEAVLERLHAQPQEQLHQPVSNKLAAVLVALFAGEDGVARVWLTQRAQHLNSHQGVCECECVSGLDTGVECQSCACASKTVSISQSAAVVAGSQNKHLTCNTPTTTCRRGVPAWRQA